MSALTGTATLDSALWVLGRGTGIVALVLLTASICLGITVRSRRTFAGLPRYGVTAIHKTASLTAAGLVAVHVLTLLLDPQAGLRLVDLVVPFAGSFRPFWLGLGTLALEVLVLVSLSGLLRKRLSDRAFRGLHLLAYALWPIALSHGLGTGTDAWRPWMITLSGLCVGAVALACWWRIGPDFGKVGRSAPARLQHPEALGAADLRGRESLVGQPLRQ